MVDSRNFKTLLAIELDDSTHNEKDRIKRDLIVNDIFEKANFPLLRVDSIKIDNEKLKQMILENIKNIVKELCIYRGSRVLPLGIVQVFFEIQL